MARKLLGHTQVAGRGSMQREHIAMFCYCDIAAQVRGKGFPVSQLAKRLRTGIGWTPTNIMLTAFGPIAESPWGPFGDLLLMPDPATVDVEFGEEHPREHFFLADVLQTDGQPWDCCPRTFLKALAALEQQAGLRLVSVRAGVLLRGSRRAARLGLQPRCHPSAFDLRRDLRQCPAQGWHRARSYLPEYGPRQYE